MGEFLHADKNAFDGSWKVFIRIRVAIDVTKPIRRKMKLKKPGGEVFWVEFKYERLPTFCFVCGILGHGEKFCPKQFEEGEEAPNKLFGAWLRAAGRRQQNGIGQKWLISDETRRTTSDGGQETNKTGIVDDKSAGAHWDNRKDDQSSRSSDAEYGDLSPQKQSANPGGQSDKDEMGQLPEIVNDEFGPHLVDQKRRRMETELREVPTSPYVSMIIDEVVSKNLLKAGPVEQARLDQ